LFRMALKGLGPRFPMRTAPCTIHVGVERAVGRALEVANRELTADERALYVDAESTAD
jgi:hypothetical protein